MRLFFIFMCWGILLGMFIHILSNNIPYLYPHNDFFVYTVAGSLVKHQQPLYGLTDEFKKTKEQLGLSFHWHLGYIYPPYLAYIFSIFSDIDPHIASWVFFAFQVFIIFLWTVWIKHEYHSKYLLPLVLFNPMLIGSLAMGQINPFIFIGFTILVFSKRLYLRGLCFSITLLTKVYTVILIPYLLLKKEWKLLFFTALLIAALSGYSVIIGKSSDSITFATQVLPTIQKDKNIYFVNQSLSPTLLKLFIAPDKVHSRIEGSQFDWLIFLVSGTVLAGLVVWSIKTTYPYEQGILVWLQVSSLIAGRMTYWNYLPSLLAIVYIVYYREHLSNWQKKIFYASIFLGYIFWWFTPWFSDILPVSTFIQRIGFMLLTSTGCITVILQTYILMRIHPVLKKNFRTGI